MSALNILLITDDQHRFDFYDNSVVPGLRTPALDRLRREGTAFTRAYSNCPICMPTRFTWLHGLYASQGHQRLLENNHDWPTGLPSMAQRLQLQGYRTALIGKLHSLSGLYPRDVRAHAAETRARGFHDVHEVCGKSLAYWYDCNWTGHLKERGLLDRYRDDVRRRIEQLGGCEPYEPSFLDPADSMDGYIGGRVREWLETVDTDRPFFVHASFCGPHFPFDPPGAYFERYRPEEMPPPVGVDDPVRVRMWRERRALYCAMIEQIDDEVGRLLAVLDRRGLSDDTIVVFTTDHGDMMGHRDRGHKGTPYDTACRTPMILRAPGSVPAGATSDALMEAVDLPCTLLDAAGVEEISSALPQTPGRSMWPAAQHGSGAGREWVYAEADIEGGWRMCADRDWKYVYRRDGDDELYDLGADPMELCNVAADAAHVETISRMQRRLIETMSGACAPNRDGKP